MTTDLRVLEHPSRAWSRGARVRVTVDGRAVAAHEGEPLAAALWAAGVRVLGRSAKYHRPRGPFCFDGHCGACLVRVDGVPNVRACVTPCREGLVAERQNAWPSAEHDALAAADWVFSGGFDPHTFLTRPAALNRAMRAGVRKLAGLGRLPDREAPAARAAELLRVDVLVVGGGAAGLAAARAAGAGALVVDDGGAPGGSLAWHPAAARGAAEAAVEEAVRAGATVRAGAAFGWFPEDGGVVAVSTHDRLLLVRAARIVVATGGYAQNALFAGNDLPGVLPARGAARLWIGAGVPPGARVVIAGEGALGAALAREWAVCGVTVACVPEIAAAVGHARVRAVDLPDGTRLPCDAVIVDAPAAPASELARQFGCDVALSGGGFAVRVDADGRTSVPGVFACGEVAGAVGIEEATASGERAGRGARETRT